MSRRSKQTGRRKESAATRSRATAGLEGDTSGLHHRQESLASKSENCPGGTQDRWLIFGVCLFLAAITWVVFGQTVHFDFVNYNDDVYVYDNPVVKSGLSLHAVGWAFTHAQVANWIPLTTLSHMLDCQLFGLRAGGHHLVNVLLHTAAAVLLFLVLRQMTGRLWCGAFVAAVFAVHPLRAESVAWVSERKDVLSAFFFMLTVGAYCRQARQPSCAGRLAVLGLFALGLLAKSMVATLPCVLLLLDYWPLGRCPDLPALRDRLREKIPMFALSAGACLAAALAPGLIISDERRLPFLERFNNAVVSCMTYLKQIVFPTGLAIPYPYPHDLPPWKVCLALVLITAISAWAVVNWKKRPFLLVGWLWFLVMLFPVSELIQINQEAAHADRYTYLPGIGLLIAGTWMVADWSAGWRYRRMVLGILMAAVTGALTICGRLQTSNWKNSETLWTRALACTSGNYIAAVNLGADLAQQGQLDKGIALYRKALEMKPDYADALNNLGVTLFAKGDLEDAIAQYQKALEINPASVAARNNLGNALVKDGKPEEGIAQYRKALEINPADEDACYNLGVALFAKGDLDGAITQYRKALEINPADEDVHGNLGTALLAKGDLEEAVAQYRKALEIAPDNKETTRNLGMALLQKGDLDGAMACFAEITTMSPDPATRWCSLGNNFLQNGNWAEAIVCHRQALQIHPGSAEACAGLGLAYYQQGEMRQAADFWQQSLAVDPDQPAVLNNLAWLLATASDSSLRDGTNAVALAERARQKARADSPMILRTLAAAYAEARRYREAADTARMASALAVEQTNNSLAITLQKEIKLYEAGRSLPENK